jgi:hypothetical protein
MIEKPPLNMTFVDTRGLFSLSDKINIEVVEVPEINNKMIVLRDLFKYPEDIREYIERSVAPIWKPTENTRNFIDYVDCRHRHTLVGQGLQELHDTIILTIKNEFNVDINYPPDNLEFITNIFQDLIPREESFIGRGTPHVDATSPHKGFSALTPFNYLPEEGRSWTSFYELKEYGSAKGKDPAKFLSENNLYETGENYYTNNMDLYWSELSSIEHEFNCTIIMPTEVYHAAKHKGFKESPRINLVSFFNYYDG